MLSVLTLNLWHDSGPYEARRARIREWLDRLEPDLIGFQEALRGPRFDQVAELPVLDPEEQIRPDASTETIDWDAWLGWKHGLAPRRPFDPQRFFDFCEERVRHGGMDRKWFPDYVRLVDDFAFTSTQKILVRELKRDHFHRGRLPEAPLYWRIRGDTAFREFSAADFAELRKAFEAAERLDLVDR